MICHYHFSFRTFQQLHSDIQQDVSHLQPFLCTQLANPQPEMLSSVYHHVTLSNITATKYTHYTHIDKAISFVTKDIFQDALQFPNTAPDIVCHCGRAKYSRNKAKSRLQLITLWLYQKPPSAARNRRVFPEHKPRTWDRCSKHKTLIQHSSPAKTDALNKNVHRSTLPVPRLVVLSTLMHTQGAHSRAKIDPCITWWPEKRARRQVGTLSHHHTSHTTHILHC